MHENASPEEETTLSRTLAARNDLADGTDRDAHWPEDS
jgi:hypothetical protein